MPNVKILVLTFEPPFEGLRVHLWLDGKRIVDFLLVVIIFFR